MRSPINNYCRLTGFLLSLMVAFTSAVLGEIDESNWESKLYIPTFIGKHCDNYIIVNCWQHRIIYNDNLSDEIADWKTLDNEIAGPHSFATKGPYLLAEDTGRHSLFFYKWTGTEYIKVQEIHDISKRPHRIQWHDKTSAFWVLTANNQKLYKFTFNPQNPDQLALNSEYDLPFLEKKYTRSFSIIDNYMYFVSGPGKIHKTSFMNDHIEVIESYPIPKALGTLGGMNDIFKTKDGWWYFSSTQISSLLRSKSLKDLSHGNFEEMKSILKIKGTPYYISEFDGKIWITSIYEVNGIISFEHDSSGDATNIKTRYIFESATPKDTQRKEYLPR